MSRNNNRNNNSGEGGDHAAATAEAASTPARHPMRGELAKRLRLSDTVGDGQLFIDACREIDALRERIQTGR